MTNFEELYGLLMRNNFMAKIKPVFGDKPTEKGIKPRIVEGAAQLPMPFRRNYATPLLDNLDSLFAKLSGPQGPDPVITETITGAVYQHTPNPLHPELDRFLAVVSNLYRSFLDHRKRANLDIPLKETLPPLATFQSDPSDGPFTITCENISSMFGGNLGVVSMPHTFANYPLFYGSLAHETGGHDVIHADLSLLPELQSKVHSVFTGKDAEWLGLLWDYWMDEAAADVYGVLNMGPTYGHSLALLLAIFIAQAQKSKSKKPLLRSSSGAGEDGNLDPHPTDILRLALIAGAVGSLQRLSPATRDTYIGQLAQLSTSLLPPGVSTVGLSGFARIRSGASMNFEHNVPLDAMQEAARLVGGMIATTQLDALIGHSIQDIETWDDADENATVAIAGRLHSNSPITSLGDDAQIVAGLTIAALEMPSRLNTYSKLANDALDGSFASDPYWGHVSRDKMVLRATRTTENPEVQVDPYAERIIDYNPLEEDVTGQALEAVALVQRHSIAPIPWPQGTAPEKDPTFIFKGDTAVLPKADFVIFTWTSAEANAMAAVMTPGAWAMPPSKWSGPAWNFYRNQWDAKFAGRSSGRAPAATNHYIGKYAVVRIGGRRVLLFKSNFHLARDNKSMPVKDMFKQVIQQTEAQLVITSGTAGAIGSKLQLGDVAVANTARFKLDGTFKSAPFNGKSYTSDYTVPGNGHIKVANSTLIEANAGQLKGQRKGTPTIYTSKAQLGEPDVIVTTDKFEFDDKQNDFHLQGLGAMVEMDDAVLGLAIDEMRVPTKWLAIRNASDPQMPNKSAKDSSDIYLKYGYWTSISSTLASWAMVLDFPV